MQNHSLLLLALKALETAGNKSLNTFAPNEPPTTKILQPSWSEVVSSSTNLVRTGLPTILQSDESNADGNAAIT